MPYIKANDGRREALRTGKTIPINAGELNYLMFYLVKHFFDAYDNTEWVINIKLILQEFLGETPNYQRYNDMTGAVVRCYRELKRRHNILADFLIEAMDEFDEEIAKYEDKKIAENTDVE
jgi:hypothetical protein